MTEEQIARINDVTENPARPWIVEDFRKGRNQWVYYCNTENREELRIAYTTKVNP